MNVAAVLRIEKHNPPTTWSGYPVIDGDKTDYRFFDEQGGHIVALSPKGKLKNRPTPFSYRVDETIAGRIGENARAIRALATAAD